MEWSKVLIILSLYILSPFQNVHTKEKGVSQKTRMAGDNGKSSTNILLNGPLPNTNGQPSISPINGGPKVLSSSEFSMIQNSNGRSKTTTYDYSRHVIDKFDYCDPSQEHVECRELSGDCLDCNFDDVKNTCEYGKNVTVECNATDERLVCKGKRKFQKEIICQYCYQTPIWQQICNGASMCNSVGAPRQYYPANCTVAPHVLCLGNRRFHRKMPCSWKNGYKWSTTLLLSVTLGGFGADRFYLGRWQEGIGKLFSFGGLGLWTFVDIILIAVRFLGPADGSLYVD